MSFGEVSGSSDLSRDLATYRRELLESGESDESAERILVSCISESSAEASSLKEVSTPETAASKTETKTIYREDMGAIEFHGSADDELTPKEYVLGIEFDVDTRMDEDNRMYDKSKVIFFQRGLKGEAKMWWREQADEITEAKWDVVKAKFLKDHETMAADIDKPALYQEIATLRQGSASVEQYIERCMDLNHALIKCGESTGVLAAAMTQGLANKEHELQFGRMYRMMASDNPTFLEAVNC